jgi:hypothetical protein
MGRQPKVQTGRSVIARAGTRRQDNGGATGTRKGETPRLSVAHSRMGPGSHGDEMHRHYRAGGLERTRRQPELVDSGQPLLVDTCRPDSGQKEGLASMWGIRVPKAQSDGKAGALREHIIGPAGCA